MCACGQNYNPVALPLAQCILGWPHSWTGCGRKAKKSLHISRIEPVSSNPYLKCHEINYQIRNMSLMFMDPYIIVQLMKKNPMVFHICKVVGRVVGGCCQAQCAWQCPPTTNFIIPYLYGAQHVSGDTPSIIRSLKLHWQPLVFYTWKVAGHVVGGHGWCPPTICPTTFHVWKTRGCQCSFRLLMTGGVSPKTCRASYKYGIIKFWYIVASCWIFLYELHNIRTIKSNISHNWWTV